MAKKSNKNVAYQIEQQLRYEMAQQKKKRTKNIITIVVCSLVVVGLVATMSLTVFLPLAQKKDQAQNTEQTDEKKDDTSATDDAKLKPADDKFNVDEGYTFPKVTFSDGKDKNGEALKTPEIAMPTNYKAPTKLETKVLENGDGAEVKKTDTISAYYTGWFPSKETFDSSYKRGEPTSFSLSGVIPGWTEGLAGKHVGDTVELVIPWEKAYGEQGQNGIPGKADLIFVVKIEDIVKDAK